MLFANQFKCYYTLSKPTVVEDQNFIKRLGKDQNVFDSFCAVHCVTEISTIIQNLPKILLMIWKITMLKIMFLKSSKGHDKASYKDYICTKYR